jgi:hypothetical protein
MLVCAKLAGNPTNARVELFTQNAYFAFQVVQIFLVVTIGSTASAVVKQIIDTPSSTPTLLATRIPTVSNFYMSYFLVQGLTVASGVISQVVGFVVFKILYKFLAGTPRKMYVKWAGLSAISWGSTLPVFTMIAVIGTLKSISRGILKLTHFQGIIYSIIAPLVLAFATIGLSFFYLAYRYNIMFVTDSQIDTKGLIYPRALQQLLTGIYIGEIVLIGLFGVAVAIGPLVMMVVFTIFTVLFHISLNSAFDPLLYNLPKSIETEEEALFQATGVHSGMDAQHNGKSGEINEKAAAAPIQEKKPSFVAKFFKPHVFSDYATLRKLVPQGLLDPDNLYDEPTEANAYFPPSVISETPLLWIPKDEGGISRQEVYHTSRIIPITDDGCTLDEKNKMVWDQESTRPPLWTEKVYY